MGKAVLIKKGNKEIEVTEKAFRVVYAGQGFKLVEEKDDVDYFTLTREQLEKLKNDDLKDFLTKEDIDFPSNANKDVLIDLILGE